MSRKKEVTLRLTWAKSAHLYLAGFHLHFP